MNLFFDFGKIRKLGRQVLLCKNVDFLLYEKQMKSLLFLIVFSFVVSTFVFSLTVSVDFSFVSVLFNFSFFL